MSAITSTGERKRLAIWIALGAAALVVLLALRPDSKTRSGKPAETPHGAAPAPAAAGPMGPLTPSEWALIDALLPARRLGAAPDGGDDLPSGTVAWDAFRPLPGASAEFLATDANPPSPDRFRLEGVSLGRAGTRRLAILNDRVVRVGDEVDGNRVVAIERGQVVLESGGHRTEISIRSEKRE
jgi:hypothetical protein